jgi:predicted RNase H-like nuclease (RuvC/YqgF family)
MEKPIIVGIDPGTTTGISILNLDGELVLIWSGKNAGKAEISQIISETGIPVVISCDTNPPPRMVEKIAATFSARLEAPKEDFLRKDKNLMTKAFLNGDGERIFRNRHERDALASALYGWSQVKNLISRIERRTLERGLDSEKGDIVKANVILNRESIDRSIKTLLISEA